jgi:hypothetical protein
MYIIQFCKPVENLPGFHTYAPDTNESKTFNFLFVWKKVIQEVEDDWYISIQLKGTISPDEFCL